MKKKGSNKNIGIVDQKIKEFLLFIMEAELDIEKAKSDLAERIDFNVEDAFRIFEQEEGANIIYEEDLKEGLEILGMNPSEKDLNILMNRFDLQKNGGITYEDFFDLVVPFEKSLRETVEEREPQSDENNKSPTLLNEEPKQYLKVLFDKILDYENQIIRKKKQIAQLGSQMGYFTKELKEQSKNISFSEYLQDLNIDIKSKECILLLIRFDKDRDNNYLLRQFIDELLS